MEHLTIDGGEQHLGFARGRVRALRLTGLSHLTKFFTMPDGTEVSVRLAGEHEYIRIEAPAKGNLYVHVSLVQPSTALPSVRSKRLTTILRIKNWGVPLAGEVVADTYKVIHNSEVEIPTKRDIQSLQTYAAYSYSHPDFATQTDRQTASFFSESAQATADNVSPAAFSVAGKSNAFALRSSDTGRFISGSCSAASGGPRETTFQYFDSAISQFVTVTKTEVWTLVTFTTRSNDTFLYSAAKQSGGLYQSFMSGRFEGTGNPTLAYTMDNPQPYHGGNGGTPIPATSRVGTEVINVRYLGGTTIDSVSYPQAFHFEVGNYVSGNLVVDPNYYVFNPDTGTLQPDASAPRLNVGSFGFFSGSAPLPYPERTGAQPAYTRKEIGCASQGYDFIQLGGEDRLIYDRRLRFQSTPPVGAFAIRANLYARFRSSGLVVGSGVALQAAYCEYSALQLVSTTNGVLATLDLVNHPGFGGSETQIGQALKAADGQIGGQYTENGRVDQGTAFGRLSVSLVFDQNDMFDPAAVWYTPPA